MEVLRETTKWKAGYHVPNHSYILDGSKILGYIPEGSDQPFIFSKPQSFSRSGRKFEKIGGLKFLKNLAKPKRREVMGSKGNVYYVDDEEGTCTCAGYTYRGYCKHLNNT